MGLRLQILNIYEKTVKGRWSNGQSKVLLKLLWWKAGNGKPFMFMKLVTTMIPNLYRETEMLILRKKENH